MCFSAQASFAGGAVISAAGVASMTRARTPEQKLFAAIPFLFAVQQFAEGVLWITLKSGGYDRLQDAATYVFLIPALVIWPTLIPLCMWLLEKPGTRKKILTGLLAVGGAVSLCYAYCLAFYSVFPQISGMHILYANDFPSRLGGIVFIFYLPATIAPLFISSVRRMWIFGVLIAASCAVTYIFYAHYLTSVWCFFAALISVAIYWILSEAPGPVVAMQAVYQMVHNKKERF